MPAAPLFSTIPQEFIDALGGHVVSADSGLLVSARTLRDEIEKKDGKVRMGRDYPGEKRAEVRLVQVMDRIDYNEFHEIPVNPRWVEERDDLVKFLLHERQKGGHANRR